MMQSLITRGMICIPRDAGLISLESPEVTSTEELKPEVQSVSGPAAEPILPPEIISIEEQ